MSADGMVQPCPCALPASRLAGGANRNEQVMTEMLKSVIAAIGIDIDKNWFHVVGLDGRGAIALPQKWSRGQVERRLANMPACPIGIEACVGAQHLSRRLRLPGLESRADAGEICAALREGAKERLPRRGSDRRGCDPTTDSR